ncbi:hypothetical protein BDV3_005550 [Batrachochytrium dendrobatidis]|nr:25S rRNA (adenine2142-N1)-methyltransferase [Batrachochytrium dendrobatidis]KAK5673350.1 25S rRNA (adenine2142-N1)-methyltransferase [Batrachochytrium dendrobatidis]
MKKSKKCVPVAEKVQLWQLQLAGNKKLNPGVSKKARKNENPNSLKQTQQLISTFHTLNKQLELVKTIPNNKVEQLEIQSKLDALGGLHAYQRASLRGGDMRKGWGATGKWILPYLKTEHLKIFNQLQNLNSNNKVNKLRLLDVGAITGETYERHASFLNVTSIDLNSQSPKVIQQDFFKRPIPTNDDERFHVLCLSLVINFVGDPAARGLMLSLSRSFLLSSGLLYIVLPLPCITNSRYMTHVYFISLLESLSFELVKHHHARKLAYYLFKKSDSSAISALFPKKILRDGGGHNNFAITLQSTIESSQQIPQS